MSLYSQLPIYNTIFFLLKEFYQRVPKFSKQYKYLLGEKMIECCVESLVFVKQISERKDLEERVLFVSEINTHVGRLLVYVRVAGDLNQFGNKKAYFFISEKVVEALNQAENWKKFLKKK